MTSRARHVGTVDRPVVADLEPEPREDGALVVGRRLEADQPVGALGPEAHDRTLGQLGV